MAIERSSDTRRHSMYHEMLRILFATRQNRRQSKKEEGWEDAKRALVRSLIISRAGKGHNCDRFPENPSQAAKRRAAAVAGQSVFGLGAPLCRKNERKARYFYLHDFPNWSNHLLSSCNNHQSYGVSTLVAPTHTPSQDRHLADSYKAKSTLDGKAIKRQKPDQQPYAHITVYFATGH